MPDNERVYGRYRNQGLVLIGIHVDPDVKQRDKVIKDHGVTYPVCEDALAGKRGGAAATYHIEYIPCVWVINRKGKILAIDPPKLEDAVKKALAEK
jgi:peroxiredoxin